MSNFIILMSDEHNPFYSTPYGNETVKTPNMQALAERGIVFENAYCPSPLCMPSRSAFVAGQRVHQLQTYSNCNLFVDPSPLSFGAALTQQGVYSVYIGKTDVYAPGNQLGFDEMILPKDRNVPGDRNHRRTPPAIRQGAAQRANGYGTSDDAGNGDIACVDEAVKWLQECAPAIESPWVLVVNVVNPHFPHIAPQKFWDMYPDGGDLPEYGSECESAQHKYAETIKQHFETGQFTEEQSRGLRRGYLGCISFVDQQLGRLMEVVDDRSMQNETNIVYTSDHGDMLGKFGMWWKCSLYEDSVRIPMIAAGPDFSVAERITTPVDLHDLQASLFAATNTTQPAGWVGEPLQDMASNDPERVIFSEYHGHGAPGSSYMIRKGKWKYIHYTDAPKQLFDLENDPDELTNLAETERSVVADMDKELRDICSPELENERTEQFIEAQLNAVV
jgi:choline-sulfatase